MNNLTKEKMDLFMFHILQAIARENADLSEESYEEESDSASDNDDEDQESDSSYSDGIAHQSIGDECNKGTDWLNSEILLRSEQFNEVEGIQAILKNQKDPFDFENYIVAVLEHLSKSLWRVQCEKKGKKEKSNAEASKLREEGKKIFNSNTGVESTKKILELYSKSIALAVPGSEEISFTYANRSTLLMKLNRPKEVLQDIEKALQSKYPKRFRPRLLTRRAECYTKLALEAFTDGKNWLKAIPPSDDDKKGLVKLLKAYPLVKEESNVVDEEDTVPKLRQSNRKYSSAADAINIQHSKTFGRHMIATRNIEMGEVLVVESPYVKLVAKEKAYLHCAYCLKLAFSTIPCDYCINTIYCSDECKNIAWRKHHEMECTLHDLSRQYDCSQTLLGARILSEMISEAGGLKNLKERVDRFQSYTDGADHRLQDKWYKESLLESVLALKTNIDKQPTSALKVNCLRALRTVFILATTTNIFGIKYDRAEEFDVDILSLLSRNPDVKFIGGLLVKLMLIASTNAYKFQEEDSGISKKRGDAVSPLLSLMNHSCCPNTWIQCKANHLALYAVLPISKGDQLFTTYGPCYGQMTRVKRQQELQSTYQFSCNCRACMENWPLYGTLPNSEKKGRSIHLKRKVSKIYEEFLDLSCIHITQRNLPNKDKVLRKLYEMLRAVHDGVDLPSKEVYHIVDSIRKIYDITGNTAALQEKPAHK